MPCHSARSSVQFFAAPRARHRTVPLCSPMDSCSPMGSAAANPLLQAALHGALEANADVLHAAQQVRSCAMINDVCSCACVACLPMQATLQAVQQFMQAQPRVQGLQKLLKRLRADTAFLLRASTASELQQQTELEPVPTNTRCLAQALTSARLQVCPGLNTEVLCCQACPAGMHGTGPFEQLTGLHRRAAGAATRPWPCGCRAALPPAAHHLAACAR